MIYYTAIKDRAKDSVVDVRQDDVDYIDSDGDMHIHVKRGEVMVTDEDDLTGLTGYEPSSIAYTAGLANVWQLAADGTWVAIIEESDTTSEENSDVTPEGSGEG